MAGVTNQQFLKMMNGKLGEDTIFTLDGDKSVQIQPVSTGIPSLDHALGIGGFPLGRIVEIYGPESSGKTTITLKTIATFQELSKQEDHFLYGKKAVFLDMEHALDPIHAKALGVDISEETGMIIAQPESGEEAYDVVMSLAASGQVGLIIVDSLPYMIPKKVLDASAEDQHVASAARMNSVNIPKVAKIADQNNCTVVFINQIRINVGQMYGNPETTPGGKTLRFSASVRASIRRKEIRKSDRFLGQEITVDIKKNKVSRPYTQTTFDYYWDTGIDVVKDIMNTAIDMKIVGRAGAWYFLGESNKNPFKDAAGNELKWQGRDALEATLKQSPALFDYINDIVQGNIPKETQFVEENDEDTDDVGGDPVGE